MFSGMGKTPAEIQRAYRERKKLKEGSTYLEKESKRVLGYYKPIAEVTKKEANSRREKTRKYVQKHRQKKKTAAHNKEEAKNLGDTSTEIQNTEVSSSSSPVSNNGTLIVRMPSFDPKKRTRKRISRSTSAARRKIAKLEEENINLNRKYKTVSKRYERLKNKTESKEQEPSTSKSNNSMSACDEQGNLIESDGLNMTPRKRSFQEIRDEGISPRKLPKVITDKVILANTLTEQIGEAYRKSDEQGKDIVVSLITGQNVKRYRLCKKLSKSTRINRNTLGKKKASTNIKRPKKRTRNEQTMNQIRQNVFTFFSRDDNSRVLPGKNDKVKTKGVYKQKRVLNDSLAYLHLKYNAEATRKISLATFCRMRPKHIALTKYLSRNKCLCQKHQNMALMLKAIRTLALQFQ